jgi:hypothetical protein
MILKKTSKNIKEKNVCKLQEQSKISDYIIMPEKSKMTTCPSCVPTATDFPHDANNP